MQMWSLEGKGTKRQSILNQYAPRSRLDKEKSEEKRKVLSAGPLSEAKEQMAWTQPSLGDLGLSGILELKPHPVMPSDWEWLRY